MRCDNIFQRCGDPNEAVTYAISECPPTVHVWALAATPSHLDIFLVSSLYTKMAYLLWRKNIIGDPEMDKDLYPWII